MNVSASCFAVWIAVSMAALADSCVMCRDTSSPGICPRLSPVVLWTVWFGKVLKSAMIVIIELRRRHSHFCKWERNRLPPFLLDLFFTFH